MRRLAPPNTSRDPQRAFSMQSPCVLCSLELAPAPGDPMNMSDVHNALSSTALLSSCQLMPVASFRVSVYLIVDLPLFLLPPYLVIGNTRL